MGYRLEFKNPNHPEEFIYATGGKLFGYIDDCELENCKSWQWLKENGFFDDVKTVRDFTKHESHVERKYDDVYAHLWTYGSEHEMFLSQMKFREFISLYIEDRNRFMSEGRWTDSLENYSEVLSLDVVCCLWF